MSPPETSSDAAVSDAADAAASVFTGDDPRGSSHRRRRRGFRRRLRRCCRGVRRWLLNARYNSDLLDPYKDAARNLPSAVCSALVLCLFSLSVAWLDWFQMRGGGCSRGRMPVSIFLYNGLLLRRTQQRPDGGGGGDSAATASLVWQVADGSYVDCVNTDVIITVRTMLLLLLLGALFTLMQLVLDLCAPKSRLLKVIQFNATGSVTTCLICVTVCGLAYWAALLMIDLQSQTRFRLAATVDISFADGFYAVAGAALVSVCSAAFNCLRSPAHLRHAARSLRSGHLSVNSGDLVMVGRVPQPLPPRYDQLTSPAAAAAAAAAVVAPMADAAQPPPPPYCECEDEGGDDDSSPLLLHVTN